MNEAILPASPVQSTRSRRPAHRPAKSLRQEIARALRAIPVQDGDVVLVQAGSRLARADRFSALQDYFGRSGRGHVILAVVEDFADLTVLKEEDMRRLGWERI